MNNIKIEVLLENLDPGCKYYSHSIRSSGECRRGIEETTDGKIVYCDGRIKDCELTVEDK